MRPVSSRTRSSVVAGSRSITSKWVTAWRGRSLRVDTTVRRERSRPIGASMVPLSVSRRPVTSARYSRRTSRARSCGEQRRVGLLGLRDHQQPRRVAVEPVHDAGALGIGPPRPGRAGRRRASARVPGSGVVDEARRLVHHEQVGVLVDDLEVGGRLRRAVGVGAVLDHHHLAGGDAVVLGPRPAVHQHRAGIDQPLSGRARAGGPARGQKGVQAQAGVLGGCL